MAIRIGIHDNQEQDIQRHITMLKNALSKLGLKAEVMTFNSREELLRQIDEQEMPDIFLMDTGKPQKEDGKEMFVAMFLLLLDMLVREEESETPYDCMADTEAGAGEIFEFKCRKEVHAVALQSICWIESDKRVIHLYSQEKQYRFYGKLDDVEARLAGSEIRFVRINKSFLVNARYIREFKQEKVVLDDNRNIWIGKKYRDNVRRYQREQEEITQKTGNYYI